MTRFACSRITEKMDKPRYEVRGGNAEVSPLRGL